jgi:hypothetical protein
MAFALRAKQRSQVGEAHSVASRPRQEGVHSVLLEPFASDVLCQTFEAASEEAMRRREFITLLGVAASLRQFE